jgi:integrase
LSRRRLVLEARRELGDHALNVTPVECLIGAARHIDVLLRHRPPSIPQGPARGARILSPVLKRCSGFNHVLMRFTTAIDQFCADMKSQGRFNSPATERDYRYCLVRHAEDVDNRDPRYTNRDDVKRTLRRWSHPNSQSKYRSELISFYDWLVEEGLRPHNPARQTRRARRRKPERNRLTLEETLAMLEAARGVRERRVIFLGLLAGARRQELLDLTGYSFARGGWIRIIGKGSKERWLPVLPELIPVVAEIRSDVAHDEYVLPAQRFRDPGVNRDRQDYRHRRSSAQALWRLVARVGERAGVPWRVTPHTMRHAFADNVARLSGDVRVAQHLMGHATLGTTEAYLSHPTLDQLASATKGVKLGVPAERTFQGAWIRPANPVEAPTGIEPVSTALQAAA